MRIFVVTHLKPERKLPPGYEYLLGGSFGKRDESLLGHKSHEFLEDNIADRNKHYSELSSLYTIYQMIKSGVLEEEMVGLVHYRRYFITDCRFHPEYLYYRFIAKEITFRAIRRCLLREKYVDGFTSNSVILPIKTHFEINVREQYEKIHFIEDLDIALDVVTQHHPEYAKTIERVLKRHYLYAYNMFVAHRDFVLEYCDWLFPLLSEIEKKIDFDARKDYQQRVLGYLSERLLNIWVEQHRAQLNILPHRVARIEGAK